MELSLNFMDYTEHFNLTDRPFKNTYDRKYFFRSVSVDIIIKVLEAESCTPLVHLKAQPKVGLTSFLRYLPKELRLNYRTALILNPHLTLTEILRQCLIDFGQEHKFDNQTPEESLLGFFQNTVDEFLADDFRVMLVVDNAAELSPETLSELYGLMELEEEWKGRFILLLGGSSETPWPVVPDILYEINELKLPPLSEEEIEAYLSFRLKVAGGSLCFNRGALSCLVECSGGLPELINQFAERALIAAWTKGAEVVGTSQIKAAVDSLEALVHDLGEVSSSSSVTSATVKKGVDFSGKLRLALVTVLFLLLGGYGLSYFSKDTATVEDRGEVVIFDVPEEAPLDAAPAGTRKAGDMAGVSAPSLPTPPPQLLTLPQGALVLVVDQDRQNGRLWQGGTKGSGLKAEITVPSFDNMGLYLFGRPRGSDPLIFQYPPDRDRPLKEARIIWPRVVNLLPQNIIPVMVAPGGNYQKPQDEEAREQILKNVKAWVQSQQHRVPNKMATLYAPAFEFFELGQGGGRTVERENFLQALNSEALTSGEVTLTTSQPLLMQDPVRSDLFWAMFNLKYESRLRNDMGIRVLIFGKSTLKAEWLIVAELWLPEKSLKDN